MYCAYLYCICIVTVSGVNYVSYMFHFELVGEVHGMLQSKALYASARCLGAWCAWWNGSFSRSSWRSWWPRCCCSWAKCHEWSWTPWGIRGPWGLTSWKKNFNGNKTNLKMFEMGLWMVMGYWSYRCAEHFEILCRGEDPPFWLHDETCQQRCVASFDKGRTYIWTVASIYGYCPSSENVHPVRQYPLYIITMAMWDGRRPCPAREREREW